MGAGVFIDNVAVVRVSIGHAGNAATFFVIF